MAVETAPSDRTTTGSAVIGSDYPDVLKVVEVASFARLDIKTVYGAISRGELQAVRCGRVIRVTKVAMLRWLGLDDDVGPPRREEGPGGETGPFDSNQSRADNDPSYTRDIVDV